MPQIIAQIAAELSVQAPQVAAAAQLLDGGSTVPFIARYRKEATGGLTDTQLRALEERLRYLRELQDRREAVLKAIDEQGKLTDALRAMIAQAPTKQELEDIYLPFRKKRRTKAQIAREFGLEPLADKLFADPTLEPLQEAAAFCQPATTLDDGKPGPDFSTPPAVLDGVRDIWAERWAEEPLLVQELRQWLWDEGRVEAKKVEPAPPGKPEEVAKFQDYFDYREAICRMPSHRTLAVLRGRALGILDVRLLPPDAPEGSTMNLAEGRMARFLGWSDAGRAADGLIRKSIVWCWRVKLALSLERDLFSRLREQAEAVAIQVFGDNVRDLLLAAPAGPRPVLGLDPGYRTGVKVAVVDATGRLVDTATIYPHEPRRDWNGALLKLEQLARQHGVRLVAIGNGTASRETDKLAAELVQRMKEAGQEIDRMVVSEAGASVYSASEFAARELPELDVSLRGAVSIARRVQDPLAELVKIEPKSIGVGQYQHDVDQGELARQLDAVVEDCVNRVGVDLNTASAPLLNRVSGLSAGVAQALVQWRDANGPFRNRQQLMQVKGLGAKTFEQAAGFLRIRDGDNPLDQTGVHPETYPVVNSILQATGREVGQIMGKGEALRALRPEQFATERFGPITVADILLELEKPGRDPRPDFVVARFNEGVQSLADIRPGMLLHGTVSNVAQFGAFVDLGVHQDGLIHVSQMSQKFVADAREVVKTGQSVKVRVLEVDAQRGRISLSLKLDAQAAPRPDGYGGQRSGKPAAPRNAPVQSAMASAFAKLRQGKG